MIFAVAIVGARRTRLQRVNLVSAETPFGQHVLRVLANVRTAHGDSTGRTLRLSTWVQLRGTSASSTNVPRATLCG